MPKTGNTISDQAVEKARKTKDVGFEIGVTKTLPITTRQAWDFLLSPPGRKLWLGTIANLTLNPGAKFETAERTTGEIRTIKAGERIRLIWHPKQLKNPSTLQLTVTDRLSTTGTCIRFHQEKLSSAKERGEMKKHWQEVLEKVAHILS